MRCRDVRECADSFLSQQLVADTNREILWHLEICSSCRIEIDGRRRVREALRAAFDRAQELQPRPDFSATLRNRLRAAGVQGQRSLHRRWMALAAGIALITGLTAAVLVMRPPQPGSLASDAVGDHWNCALKYRLIRRPVPLEDAARRFDSAYRLLRDTPPNDIATPDGTARVVDRHSCAYGTRRFGHVVLQYRGHVVSLLVTSIQATTPALLPDDAAPHVLGPPIRHLSVVSVTGSRHAVLLVGDLPEHELTQLADVTSVPLSSELASAVAVVAPQGITTPFREILVSIKPNPRAYRLGVDRLHLAKQDILFAAFGDWDAAGAKAFGYPNLDPLLDVVLGR
jgi:hypothetical protein